MLHWAIRDELLRGQRPGYSGEQAVPVSQSEVDAWLEDAKALGTKSIICLLAEDHLDLYETLPGGLIGYYRDAGLNVVHVPARDHKRPPLTACHLAKIWDAFTSLPKPVLIHCSAGVDRTGRAVEYILERLNRVDYQ